MVTPAHLPFYIEGKCVGVVAKKNPQTFVIQSEAKDLGNLYRFPS